MTDAIIDDSIIHAQCRKLDHSDPEFAAWLANHIRSWGTNTGLGNGKRHEYWAVPYELMKTEEANLVLAPGRDSFFLCDLLNKNEAVLAVAPEQHWLVVKAQAVLGTMIMTAVPTAMWLMDPIFKWGEKTCPQCINRKLIPFTVESADEHPHHYCNGCNTNWPPRG